MTGRRLLGALALVGVAACSSACGGPPNGPTPQPPALTISCPANMTSASMDGNPVMVSFDAPSSSGGTGTITTTCTPSSGSLFAVGSSVVNCESRDAAARVASCSFAVTVTAPPRLTATRFLAFGDSLTAGVLSPSVTLMIVSPPTSFPFQLERRLVAEYRQQTPVVLNEGNAGELASGGGVQRFRSVLLANRPEVVLLMEGTNDLLFGQIGADFAIDALGAMVREAKSQGIRIAISTIPPQRAGGLRNRDAVVRLIPPFNDGIRALATAENIPLIDVYAGLQADMSLIGIDDLHMTERGYEVVADVYLEAIKANFAGPGMSIGSRW